MSDSKPEKPPKGPTPLRPNALLIALGVTILALSAMALTFAALGGSIPFVNDGCGKAVPNNNVTTAAMQIASTAVGGLLGMGMALVKNAPAPKKDDDDNS